MTCVALPAVQACQVDGMDMTSMTHAMMHTYSLRTPKTAHVVSACFAPCLFFPVLVFSKLANESETTTMQQ